MASFIVPPGGFVGFNSMTPASRAALRGVGARANGPRRRKRRTKKAKASARRRSGGRKMKFGSPAWQKKYRVGRFAKKK